MSNDKDTLIGFMLNTVSVFKFHSLQIGTVIFDQTIMIILWTHLNRTHYLCNIVFNATILDSGLSICLSEYKTVNKGAYEVITKRFQFPINIWDVAIYLMTTK